MRTVTAAKKNPNESARFRPFGPKKNEKWAYPLAQLPLIHGQSCPISADPEHPRNAPDALSHGVETASGNATDRSAASWYLTLLGAVCFSPTRVLWTTEGRLTSIDRPRLQRTKDMVEADVAADHSPSTSARVPYSQIHAW